MMDTFDEMCDTILVRIDVLELVELLDITAAEILDRFEDKVMLEKEKIEEYIHELD
jgi:hypothetical protein